MKHWTEFLPEAGTIKIKGEKQSSIMEAIKDLNKQITILEHEYIFNEKELKETALKEWTEDEIKLAQSEAKKVNDSPMHPIFQNILSNFGIK